MSTAPSTDVLIIGGGLLGCATAYFLTRLGRTVTVVDRGEIGAEASGATSGNLHLQLSPATHKDGHDDWMAGFARQLPYFRAGLALWQALGPELGRDLELRVTGGLMVADNEAQLQALRAKIVLEEANGLAVELIGPAALSDRAPYLGDGFLGAAYCPEEGMANSLTALIALADGAAAGGARLSPHTPITGIDNSDGMWDARTGHGSIRCRNLVIAAGCWSDTVSAMAGVRVPISSRAIHVGVSEPAAPFLRHLCYHTDLRLTLKQVANGNIVIGGGWSAAIDRRDRPVVLRQSLVRSLWVAQHVVPAVGELALIRSWAGRNVYTPDGWPILGPVPGRPGLHLAVCNTYGFTLGPLCGRLVAELIAGKPASIDPAPFSVARFGAAAAPTATVRSG